MKAVQKIGLSAKRVGLVLLAGLSLLSMSPVTLADCSSSNGCADTYRSAISDAQNGYLGYFQDLQLGQSLGGTKFNQHAQNVSNAADVGGTQTVNLPWFGNQTQTNGAGGNIYGPGTSSSPSESGGVNYN